MKNVCLENHLLTFFYGNFFLGSCRSGELLASAIPYRDSAFMLKVKKKKSLGSQTFLHEAVSYLTELSLQSAYGFQSPTLIELSRGNMVKEEVVHDAHVPPYPRSGDFSFDMGCFTAAALSVWFNAVTS